MTLTAAAVYQRQYQAMLEQVVGYGSSLAKFMAAQNAVSLLAEDWAAYCTSAPAEAGAVVLLRRNA